MESQQQVVIITGGQGFCGMNMQEVVTILKSHPPHDVQQSFEELQFRQDNQSLDVYLASVVAPLKFVYLERKDADLRNLEQTIAIFEKHKPTYVIHLAARVGGLFANMKDKVGFYEDNMLINQNVVKCCHTFKVKTLLSALSTCVFPDREFKDDSDILKESDIHNGPPHQSNEGYAYAKRNLEIQSRLYNEQYGTDFRCAIPTNLYGKYDVQGLTSHVAAALIEKAYQAKKTKGKFIVLGSGKPLRQFCYAQDLCKLMLWQLFHPQEGFPKTIALVPEEEHTIRQLADSIAHEMGVTNIEYDTTKEDGQYRKIMSNSIMRGYLKDFKFTQLEDGLRQTIKFYNTAKAAATMSSDW